MKSQRTRKAEPGRGPKPANGRGRGLDKSPLSDFNEVTPTFVEGDGATSGYWSATATAQRDRLTGQAAGSTEPTLFRWQSLRDSRLKGRKKAPMWDVVQNFNPVRDRLDAPDSVSGTTITDSSGAIRRLRPGQINAKALGAEAFAANTAAAFTCQGYDGIFVVANNGVAGYQHRKDALMFLEGVSLEDGGAITIF